MIRTVDVRFDIYRDNAKITELRPTDRTPVIRMRRGADIKTSFSGEFLPNKLVNWLTDEIRPVLIIDDVEHSCGIYNATTIQDRIGSTGRTQRLEAYDRCWLAQTTRATDSISISSGKKYTTAIQDLLTECGITDVYITESSLTLSEVREWEIGSSYLDIINELLKEINYEGLWFDSSGQARVAPIASPTDKNVQHRFDSTKVASMMLADVSEEMDIYNQPNRFVCVCSNPEKTAVLKSIAINNDIQSKLSTIRRGRVITTLIKLDNIADQAELDKYAANVCRESKYQTEKITINTALLPEHGVGDVCSIVLDDLSGICVESGYEMEMVSGGNMTHTLEREVLS